jgi:uncharacterized protein (TIGR03083 family)
MSDCGLLYAATRERISTLVRDLDAAAASTPVAACPGWTVHDVVAHFAGSVTDALAGRLEGMGSDDWTAAQIESRRDTPIGDLVDEWADGAPQFEEGLRAIGPPLAALAVSDAFQHEQDIRGALGLPGGRDVELLLVSIQTYVRGLASRIEAIGLAPLRVVAGVNEYVAGEGEPGATVTAEPFELARALGGRRTVDEVRSLDWNGDPEPYLPLVSAYGEPVVSLGER